MEGLNDSKYDLIQAFPRELEKAVYEILCIVPNSSKLWYSDFVEMTLSGEPLFIPYRIYYNEPDLSHISILTHEQEILLYTLFTRHHDGFVREKNLKRIVAHASEFRWITPYLMLLVGEYVEAILQIIYDNPSCLQAIFIKDFVRENPKFYRTVQKRVVSYWDCYYRWKCPKREHYVGFQILDSIKKMLDDSYSR